MRIELSIKTTYLPDWTTQSGVREIIQNAKDAETEFKAPMKIWHNNHVLKIENKGAHLPHEALLMGYTSKADRRDLIGMWGEGLKGATLCLTRAGHKVVIRSGDEIWKPLLIRSEKFQAEVLAFDISKGKDCNGVIIEIDKIPYGEWLEMRQNFLFLLEKTESIHVPSDGDILLDPEMRGKLFVKGIFVQNEPKLKYGYNLINASTDRDRRMIASYDLGWRLASIWSRATYIKPNTGNTIYDLLFSETTDVENISAYNVSTMSVEAKEAILGAFKQTFGEEAIPVANLLESKELSYINKTGVIVTKQLSEILQALMGLEGGIATLRKRLGEEIIQRHSWMDLSEKERHNLERVLELLERIGELVPWSNIEIATFRSPQNCGMYNEGKIIISKHMLANKGDTLATLIHERAHSLCKADGEQGHMEAVERSWIKVFNLLERKDE